MGLGFPAGLAACGEGACNDNRQAVPRQSDQNAVTSPTVLPWVGCKALGAGGGSVVCTSGDGAGDTRGMQMQQDSGQGVLT